jgi:hypothetical protein
MNRPLVALAIVSVLSACQKSGKDDWEKAEKAQVQANAEITNAQIQAADKVSVAQAQADKTIAEAQHDFNVTREDYRHKMQSRLDDLDEEIADLDAKVKTATPKAKLDLDAKSSVLRTQRDAFAADLRTVSMVPMPSWDATKSRLDKEWRDLRKAADETK